jgi:hypothetical protein
MQGLNPLFEPFLNFFLEERHRNLLKVAGSTATGQKVMLHAAGGTKTVQKVMLASSLKNKNQTEKSTENEIKHDPRLPILNASHTQASFGRTRTQIPRHD